MAKKITDTKAVVVKADTSELIPVTSNTSSAMAMHLDLNSDLFKGIEKSVTGEDKEIYSNDILIPKIWLAQQMSESVKDEKAKIGDFLSSTTKEILAVKGTGFDIIVLRPFKRWHTFELDAKGKKQFVKSDIMTKENAKWKYEDTLEGKAIVRRQVISAYVLLLRDVQKGFNTPYVIDFASTSKGAGRLMLSDIATMESNGAPSWLGYFTLSAHEESNDEGDFFVKDVEFKGYLNPKNEKLMTHLRDCYDNIMIHKDALVPDDSDIMAGRSIDDLDKADSKTRADRVANAKI